jgi:putative ABC transport system ATP-binding protein
MFALVGEVGAALVMVTHDAALAERAGRRVTMAGGRIVSGA